jgi:hypothetical protein
MNSTTEIPTDFFCSELTREAGLQLFGTAPRADVWFMLEHDAPWGKKAFEESSLSEDFKTQFLKTTSAIPHSKLQLIKQGHRAEPKYLYIADCLSSTLLKIPFKNYEELLEFDFPVILKNENFLKTYATHETLVAVCTNGKRDKCCAKFGLELFNNFQPYFKNSVWQTSHIGGHRFAPTFVHLPSGVCYGFASNDNVAKIAEDISNNLISLANVRGRSIYSKYDQAAEYFLMEKTGDFGLSSFELLKSEQKENGWEISFKNTSSEILKVSFSEEDSGVMGFASCGDAKMVSTKKFVLKSID